MDLESAFLSQFGVLTGVILIVCAVYKVFQISGQLSEIKDLLADIRRNTQDFTPASVSTQPPRPPGQLTESEMYRALHDDSYLADPPPPQFRAGE